MRERPEHEIPTEVSIRIEEIHDARARFVLRQGLTALTLTARRSDFFSYQQRVCDWLREELGAVLRHEQPPSAAEHLGSLQICLETAAMLDREPDTRWLAAVLWSQWSRGTDVGVSPAPLDLGAAPDDRIDILLGDLRHRPTPAVEAHVLVAEHAADEHEVTSLPAKHAARTREVAER
ncbi:MAG: hypothetical protein R3B99_18545 [Polyangiales bacterium]